MADSPDLHPPHKAHGGGVNWLELVISIAALFTSAVSVWIAVQHGRVMEKLVAANSMPYVEVVSGNAGGELDGANKPSYLNLRNVGVGPARVESLQVTGPEGRRFRTLREVVTACCAADLEKLQDSYTIFNLRQYFIPARETAQLFTIRRTRRNAEAWSRFDRYRDRLHVTGCYCSVFDECYRFDNQGADDRKVRTCPVDPAHEFRPLL